MQSLHLLIKQNLWHHSWYCCKPEWSQLIESKTALENNFDKFYIFRNEAKNYNKRSFDNGEVHCVLTGVAVCCGESSKFGCSPTRPGSHRYIFEYFAHNSTVQCKKRALHELGGLQPSNPSTAFVFVQKAVSIAHIICTNAVSCMYIRAHGSHKPGDRCENRCHKPERMCTQHQPTGGTVAAHEVYLKHHREREAEKRQVCGLCVGVHGMGVVCLYGCMDGVRVYVCACTGELYTIFVCVCNSPSWHVGQGMFVYTCVCVPVCVYVCMYVCNHIHACM